MKLSSPGGARYLESLGNCLEDTSGKHPFQIDRGERIRGEEDGFRARRSRDRVRASRRVSRARFSIRACVHACERASERSYVHACVCTSVCSADVKADPGLRVQAAAASLLALTPCKIPVAVSFFVAFEHHRRESPGEPRDSGHRTQELACGGARGEGRRARCIIAP